jgi:hypothetical protein
VSWYTRVTLVAFIIALECICTPVSFYTDGITRQELVPGQGFELFSSPRSYIVSRILRYDASFVHAAAHVSTPTTKSRRTLTDRPVANLKGLKLQMRNTLGCKVAKKKRGMKPGDCGCARTPRSWARHQTRVVGYTCRHSGSMAFREPGLTQGRGYDIGGKHFWSKPGYMYKMLLRRHLLCFHHHVDCHVEPGMPWRAESCSRRLFYVGSDCQHKLQEASNSWVGASLRKSEAVVNHRVRNVSLIPNHPDAADKNL